MDENIDYYYGLLQENISIVEEDEENHDALEAVTVNFKAVFEYIKMFLIAKKERYYGYFLMDMELRIDYYFSTEAGVNMDTMPFNIIINPLLMGRRSIKEMIYILCHEIEHIVLEHPAEGRKINSENDPWKNVALNCAMDASVNDRLDMEINKYRMSLMASPDDNINSSLLSDEYGVKLDKLKDYLYYYDKIESFETKVIENKEFSEEVELVSKAEDGNQKEEPGIERDSGEFEDCEDTSFDAEEKDDKARAINLNQSSEAWIESTLSKDNKPEEALGTDDDHFWDDADALIGISNKRIKSTQEGMKIAKSGNTMVIVLGEIRPTRIITAKNKPRGLSLHRWTQLDLPEEILEQLRQFIQEVVDGIPEGVRGLFPDHQREALKRALEKPCIRWENVLRKYIGTLPNGYKKTRTRLNRRQPERFDISGKISRRTIDIVVAIDTSGSMTASLLEKIFNEIFTILKSRDFSLTIIECDAEVQSVYEARSISDVRLEVAGRGGTSFTPVIKYVNDNKKFRRSLLIYFTDGEGDESIPFPMVYRMLWVLPYKTGQAAGAILKDRAGGRLSVREPYGDVISMNVE